MWAVIVSTKRIPFKFRGILARGKHPAVCDVKNQGSCFAMRRIKQRRLSARVDTFPPTRSNPDHRGSCFIGARKNVPKHRQKQIRNLRCIFLASNVSVGSLRFHAHVQAPDASHEHDLLHFSVGIYNMLVHNGH